MTNSVRINLLPHRAQKRMARKRQFISLAVLLSIAALAVVGLVHLVMANQIDHQNTRSHRSSVPEASNPCLGRLRIPKRLGLAWEATLS